RTPRHFNILLYFSGNSSITLEKWYYTRELPVGIVPSLSSVQQLSSASSHLPSRALSLWDSECGCAPFVNQTAEFPVDKLMRLRSNLCLWGRPAA
ncbi:hypothetical protein, partial [Microcoleus sp. F4-D5]|uniref:hypothetical protein n=1 Tax=Microcoleus sp. F4-D5 TaxID=2818760 RepID=UPI002FD5BEA1